MRKLFLLLFLTINLQSFAQKKADNIIIITTDGFRWQEMFGGVDTTLANNRIFSEGGQGYIDEKFGNVNPLESRKRLLPFIWGTIAEKGQIYGNRHAGNKVNVSNPYWFSYPGYSEIFCGFADRILNKERSQMPVISAFDNTGGNNPTANEKLINAMRNQSYKPWGMGECLDVFTHYAALEHFKIRQPKVLYISYGETDEWAHAGKYKSYLNAAHQFDEWVKELWSLVQSTPGYMDNTIFFITTDHGRGDVIKNQWTDHGSDIKGADEIWFIAIGPGIAPKGEIKQPMQIYQKQFAKTFGSLIGFDFKGENVAERITQLWR